MHTPLWQMRLVVTLLLVVSGILAHLGHGMVYAATFSCAAGNVACLIAAIHAANATPVPDTIQLAAGTYLLTTVDNTTDGANGLPSVTGPPPFQTKTGVPC
jgi:hypothetical protein